MPLIVIKRIGGGGLFTLYTARSTGWSGTAEIGGLIAGLGYGLVLGGPSADRHPGIGHRRRRDGGVAPAWRSRARCSLRNIADVKPEIARAIAAEERPSAAYQSALARTRRDT